MYEDEATRQLQELWRARVAEAQQLYEDHRTPDNLKILRETIGAFTDLVTRGVIPGSRPHGEKVKPHVA